LIFNSHIVFVSNLTIYVPCWFRKSGNP